MPRMPASTRSSTSMCVDDLSEDGKALYGLFQEEFNKIHSKIDAKFEEMKKKFKEVDSLKRTVSDLQNEIKVMKKEHEAKIKMMENAQDAADQYERKDTIIISGSDIPLMNSPPAAKENTHQLVIDMVKQKLNVDLVASDINTCHRLGPVRGNSRRRNIIVKLCRRDKKKEIVSASKQLKSRNFACQESLTPLRRTIYHALRKIKQDHPTIVKGCSTQEGKIFAYTDPAAPGQKDQRHHIATMDDLKEFCQTYVKRPFEDFLQTVASGQSA